MSKELEQLRAALTDYYVDLWRRATVGIEGEKKRDLAFAEALGVSDSLVNQLRRGAKNVTIEHLAQLAAAQEMPVIGVLADVAGLLARKMRGPEVGVPAPGSMEGSAVTPALAEKMRRTSEAAGPIQLRPVPPRKHR